MIDASEIASALKLPCPVSSEMQSAVQLWEDVYFNRAYWLKKRVRSLRLPAVVCKELKRLILKEFVFALSDAELQSQFLTFLPMLRRQLDSGLAMGGILFKPYWSANGLQLDFTAQNQYLPTAFTNHICTSAVCPETLTIGKDFYTRLEIHEFNPVQRTHRIQNRCFRSGSSGFLGQECSLKEVPMWSGLLTEKIYPDVRKPLFSVFQVPDANSVDISSPLGISVFSDAVDFVHDADEHWERILWELESSERAIDASEDLFRFKDGKPQLPQGRERMFHTYSKNGLDGGTIFNTFSPEIRDTSYFHAFNQILRRIESACGLAYGTLSEVEDMQKTAEEVRASKQRSFDRVNDIQQALQAALENMVYAMQYLRDYYRNQKNPESKVTFTFGDGVLEDPDKEFQRRVQLVSIGALSREELVKWYFSCDEKKAKEMMPVISSLFGGQNADTITI